MNVTINSKSREFCADTTLASAVLSLCADPRYVITEVNGAIIKKALWDTTVLKNGDTVELVALVGGG